MLSISNVSAGMAASGYYTRESYYAKDAGEAKEASNWFGSGAAAAGLSGQVDTRDFNLIMQGKVPDGPQLGRVRNGEIQHAPGTDLTFSAPKSVSILGLVIKDQRVISAHDESVKAALGWAEKNLIQTRVFKDGHVQEVGNQKMVAAMFRQDTSRNLDPQLHTHSVIANMVQGEDGQWRSLHNTQLYDNKMFLGQFYRAELAARLEKLGYDIVVTHSDGRFEVAQVPAAAIEAFSSRSKDIREAMAGYEVQTARAAENAALMTREVKKDLSPAELQAEWHSTAAGSGFDIAGFQPPGLETEGQAQRTAGTESWQGRFSDFADRIKAMWTTFTGSDPNAGTLQSPDAAVAFAIEHLSEREAAFKDVALLEAAMAHAYGAYTPSEIIEAIGRAQASGALLRSEKITDNYKNTFTVPAAARLENEIHELIGVGVGKGMQVLDRPAADARLEGSILNEGQQNAAAVILSAPDRNVSIQGFAGVGKTKMVEVVHEIGKEAGVKFLGLAPTASAAGTLQQETGIASQTVQSFILEYERYTRPGYDQSKLDKLRDDFRGTILVIDEASFLSNSQERDLLRIANALEVGKKVELGDEKQHGAVEAGKPFSRSLDTLVTGARMTEIRRQQNPDLLEAVKWSLVNDIEKAFEKIGPNNIHEVSYKNDESPEKRAAAAWLALPAAERTKTLLVTQNKTQRATANETVRQGLIKEGVISGPSYIQKTLEPRHLTNAQIRNAQYYREHDTVIFHLGLSKHHVKPGASYVVTKVNTKGDQVVLRSGNKTLKLRPSQISSEQRHGISVYKNGEVQMQAGLTVRWTANDKARGLKNTHVASVTKVEAGDVTLRLKDGKEITMSKNDPQLQFLLPGYAMTSQAAQGMTEDRVFATFSGAAQFTTNQRSFYVSISRAKHDAQLFVYDVQRTIEKIRETSGAKLSSLEALMAQPSTFDLSKGLGDQGIQNTGPSLGEKTL